MSNRRKDAITIKKTNIPVMYFEANTFKNAYDEKIMQIHSNKVSNTEYPIPYCITMATFACELYLKFILSFSQVCQNDNIEKVNITKTHRLDHLYDQLADEYKKKINKQINENSIKTLSNTFTEWRYVFESEELHKLFDETNLNNLLNALYEIAYKAYQAYDNPLVSNDTIELSMYGQF